VSPTKNCGGLGLRGLNARLLDNAGVRIGIHRRHGQIPGLPDVAKVTKPAAQPVGKGAGHIGAERVVGEIVERCAVVPAAGDLAVAGQGVGFCAAETPKVKLLGPSE